MVNLDVQSLYQLALSSHETVKSCVEFLRVPSVFEQRFDFLLGLCVSEDEREECRKIFERVRNQRLQSLVESEERLTRTTLNMQAFQGLLTSKVGST